MTSVIKQLKQDIFNDVWIGAKSQGFVNVVSEENGGGCAYRGGENNCLKCNVGHLIPDENYTAEIEGSSIDDMSVWTKTKYKDRLEALYGQNMWKVIEFLGSCQNAHDHSVDPMMHKQALVQLAKLEELEIPE